jgi:hypothetical protein
MSEEVAQDGFNSFWKLDLRQGHLHQSDPSIASRRRKRIRSVSHSQRRMTSFLDVRLRTSQSVQQKTSQPVFSSCEIIERIHRSQYLVGRDLSIKGRNQSRKAILADNLEDGLCRFFAHLNSFPESIAYVMSPNLERRGDNNMEPHHGTTSWNHLERRHLVLISGSQDRPRTQIVHDFQFRVWPGRAFFKRPFIKL